MRGSGVIKKTYHKICKLLSIKRISWMAIVVFILLLLPICYLSFVNRASGDDYGYGILTRSAWITTHSLLEVGKAAWTTIKNYYYTWQGTWFSIFLFSLQPEVFHQDAYVIVVFLVLFLWIGSTFLLLKEILHKRLKMNVWSYCLCVIILLILGIEFIPNTRSSIFWYNGAVHYTVPFSMCQLLIVWLLRYGEKYKPGYFAGTFVLMTLLGGANYQAALLAAIVTVYAVIINYAEKKDKRIFMLIFPFAAEMLGLIISMKAPGNKVRGGEGFGFSLGKGVQTIGLSFVEGMKDAVSYISEKPLVYVGLLCLFVIMLETLPRLEKAEEGKNSVVFEHPILSILALVCLSSAMQAPEIYAGVSVSEGVHNTNFLVFLLCAFGILLIIAEKLLVKIQLTKEELHRWVVIPIMILCVFFVVVFKGDVRKSTSWSSVEYIASGQAADYKEQMELQTRLLMDEATEDVVVPGINWMQGPLMHMPIIEDPDGFTNWAAQNFYGKNSVVAIPRVEWNEKYADEWQQSD